MKPRKGKSGQTMLEYIIVFVLLLGAAFAFRHFFGATRKSSVRTAVLMSSEHS